MDHDIPLVDALIDAGHLDPSRRADTIGRLAADAPSASQWAAFLHLAGLGFGASSMIAGVVYLVAFNWAALGIGTKLCAVFAAMVACAAGAAFAGPRSVGGSLMSAGAAVLAGAGLVVYSQVYQSGADYWVLFASWSALAAPFVLASRTQPLFAIQIALIDATVSTWSANHSDDVTLSVATATAVAHLALAEAFYGRWLQGALRLLGMFVLTAVACAFVVDHDYGAAPALLVVLLVGFGSQVAYLARMATTATATIGYFSLVAVGFVALVDAMFDLFSADAFIPLFLGTVLLVATGFGFAWLLGVPRIHQMSRAWEET